MTPSCNTSGFGRPLAPSPRAGTGRWILSAGSGSVMAASLRARHTACCSTGLPASRAPSSFGTPSPLSSTRCTPGSPCGAAAGRLIVAFAEGSRPIPSVRSVMSPMRRWTTFPCTAASRRAFGQVSSCVSPSLTSCLLGSSGSTTGGCRLRRASGPKIADRPTPLLCCPFGHSGWSAMLGFLRTSALLCPRSSTSFSMSGELGRSAAVGVGSREMFIR